MVQLIDLKTYWAKCKMTNGEGCFVFSRVEEEKGRASDLKESGAKHPIPRIYAPQWIVLDLRYAGLQNRDPEMREPFSANSRITVPKFRRKGV